MNVSKFQFSTSLCAAAFIAASAFSTGCNNAAAPQPITGTEAPLAASAARRQPTNEEAIKNAMGVPISKLDGTTFKLADYQGKVLVLDFWATYCPPCVKQAPQLARLNETYRDKGLVVVGLTSDEKAEQPKVEEFIKKAGINYTIGYDNTWISSTFMKGTEDETGSPPIPQLFVLSRDGRVVEHLIGERPGGLQYLEKVVNEQLNSAR